MRFPRWLLIPFLTVALGMTADRVNLEHRLSTLESSYKDIQQRLDRIEGKVDMLVERGRK